MSIEAELFPVGGGGKTGYFFEKSSEGAGIFIAGGMGDVFYGLAGCLKEGAGFCYAEILEVLKGGIAGGLFESSGKGALAQACLFCKLGYGDGIGRVFLHPVLDMQDLFVTVGGVDAE